MNNSLVKGVLILALGTSAAIAGLQGPVQADGSIPIPVTMLARYDEAYNEISKANQEISVIRARVNPYNDAIRAICEATLYQAGVQTGDVGKYELDPTSKTLRLKK